MHKIYFGVIVLAALATCTAPTKVFDLLPKSKDYNSCANQTFAAARGDMGKLKRQDVSCGAVTCDSGTLSCCSQSVNPCCLLSVGSAVCCSDQCYASGDVCCDASEGGGACAPANPVCCLQGCCQSGQRCSSDGSSCITAASGQLAISVFFIVSATLASTLA